MLEAIAAFFRQTEPHSPIPYTLEQTVRWGRMPLPDLLAELIPDSNARQHYFRMVGIPAALWRELRPAPAIRPQNRGRSPIVRRSSLVPVGFLCSRGPFRDCNMISQSIHAKLGRVRKPRVHITYDVETEGAVIQKELPFVVGVIGDFSGKPTTPLPPLKDRKFVQIDRDNFNEVLERMRPALSFKAPNLLKGDGSELPVAAQLRVDG